MLGLNNTRVMPSERVDLPDTLKDTAWGFKGGDLGRVSRVRDGIQVTFPRGGYASKNGVNLKGFPSPPFPSKDITLKYRVYVPDDFDFVKGGKLPGVIWADGAGGRDWGKGGSARLMWRRGGVVVGYLYLSTTVGSYNGTPNNPMMKAQSNEFQDVVHHTNGAGLDVWRHGKDPMVLKRGEWNSIKIRVKLNSKNKSDGVLSIRVNNKKKRIKGVMYVRDPDEIPLSGVQFATWYGGGSSTYAPKKDEHLVVKAFSLISRVKKLFK